MKEVNARVYNSEKEEFFAKNNNDFTVITSSMDKCGRYSKEYVFEDGSAWYEHMSPVVDKVSVESHGVHFEVEVKLLRIEYYSTDDSASRYYYEKF